MKMLIEEFDGEVPRTLDELTRLPGVARKTANVVASELGDTQGIVVDTHVRRLSQRLGLTRQDDPVKIERDLQRLVPREYWGVFPHLLDLARPARLHRARPALRRVRAQRSVSVGARRARATISPPSSSYAGKKSAVTGWVRPFRVRSSSFSPSRRTPHSRESSERVLPVVPAGSARSASMTSFPSTSFSWYPVSSEDAAADGEDARLRIADDEAGARRGVVVVHQLEQEAEAAVAALRSLLGEAFDAVDVDRRAACSWGR